MKKSLLSFALAFALLFSACSSEVTNVSDASDASDTVNNTESDGTSGGNYIFICPILENEYWEACSKGVEKADVELGTTTKIIGPQTADNFTEKIVDYMRQAIDEQPDGIMLYAGLDALAPLIDEAADKGIPVITVDSDNPDTKRVAYVGPDTYNMGYQAGLSMAAFTGGTAKVGILISSYSATKEVEVIDAFSEAIQDYNIEIVAYAETDADLENSEEASRKMLEEHPEINAIFNTAGYNVTGAARTKLDLGLDDLVLIGFDDTEENISLLKDGVIDAILVQKIEQMGYQAIHVMKEYIENGTLAKDSYDTGYTLVNQSNVDFYDSSSYVIEENKTVRVGWYSGNTRFQDGFSDDERKSGYAYDYYQAIANFTGWKYEYVYGTRSEIVNMLIDGDIDIMAGAYRTAMLADQFIFSNEDMGLDGTPRYFALNKERTDLLSDLNYAMLQVDYTMPNFALNLYEKYYDNTVQQMLSDGEKQWLSEKGELKIGYVRYNLPLCDQDEDGNPVGLISDLIDMLESYLQVDVIPVCYDNIDEMDEANYNGEVEIAFPMYSDLWMSETRNYRQTNTFVSDRVMVVFTGTYSDDMFDVMAATTTGIGQKYYISEHFPDTQMNFYDSMEEALGAIADGRERCTIGCSSVIQRFLNENSSEYSELKITYLDTAEDFCMSVAQEDAILAGILNKALSQMDDATITSLLMQYSSSETKYSFIDILKRYSYVFILLILVFFAVLLLIFLAYIRKTRIFNKEQAQARATIEDALKMANAANEAKTTFLSSMSHDIRTPMNAIVGMTSIASKRIDDHERVKDCLDKIALSSHHLLTLINDVLDISKIESGKLALNPVTFSLRDMVSALVNIVRPQIQSKNLNFDVHTINIDYETVFADEVRVNQIFINILTNAVKYTPDGKKITMDLEERVLEKDKTVRLIYTVEDEGIGMSKEFMEKMYDTFARAEDTRINNIQGTGLGLAIVKQMVDIMKGTVECQSQLDKGTKFTVTLDLPVITENSEKPPLPHIKVLLVDDDEIFLETAEDMMNDMGLITETANSGAAAVGMAKSAFVKGDTYPLIIVDWKMPDMDGLETVKAIRSVLGREVPIILVSAYDWTDIEDQINDSEIDGFISKPLFRSCIYDKLIEVLRLGKEEAPESKEYGSLMGKHVLVAEDNELNWEIISELLNMHGIKSDRAENGQVCCDMLNSADEGTYDLVLMDIQMPVMNGRDATRAIRASKKEYVSSIPIIAMTADAFAEDIAASLEAGMDAHISKPVNMDTLLQKMEKILFDKNRGK